MAHSPFTIRAFRRETDLDPLVEMIEAAWRLERAPCGYLHSGDFCWRMRNPEYEERLTVWEVGADLVGFAEFNPSDTSFEIHVHPSHADGALAVAMLDWVEPQADEPVTVYTMDADEVFTGLLAARGYAQRPAPTHFLHQILPKAMPDPPELPAGYEVRALRGIHEIEARALGHRRGWENNRLTDSHYRRLMDTPRYRPDLDVAVVTTDGEFVATANFWLDSNGTVLIEPVSTVPEHRQKGLGRAMLSFGLGQALRAGARDAWIGAAMTNEISNRLYQGLGFRVARKDVKYVQTDAAR